MTTSTQRGFKAALVLWPLSLPPLVHESCSKTAAVSQSTQAAPSEMCSWWLPSLYFFTPSKGALQSTFERCSGSPVLLPPGSVLCAVSRRAKVQAGSWFLFSESLSIGHPRNTALGNKVNLKHGRDILSKYVMSNHIWNRNLRQNSSLFPGNNKIVYLYLPTCPSTFCLHSRS